MRRDFEKVKAVLADFLHGQFKRIRILEINVHDDMDTSGDEILVINIIFEGSPDDVDPKKLAGIERLLRPKLDEIQETAFPLVSFISKTDIESNRRASR
jgi:hypothetical protein